MKNFSIKDEQGKTYWISRSVAVVAAVLCMKDNEPCVLANKRGPGTPDFQGLWNVTCGYLDWDETAQEACSREVFEECGVRVDPKKFCLMEVKTNPTENNQNVILRHVAVLSELPEMESPEGGEKDEVEEVKWIPIKEIRNYKWAFNHLEMIREIYLELNPFADDF